MADANLTPKMGRIGIYSGTFDPIHVGHVEFALTALKECALDKVIFLTESSPREKTTVSSSSDREAMIQIAISGNSKLGILSLSDKQFSVKDTLPQLQLLYPGSALVFLMGSDLARTFTYRWEGLDILLRSVELAIGLRAQDTAKDVSDILEALAKEYKIAPRYTNIPSPRVHLASTNIRQGTHDITDVDPNVADYIVQKGLYEGSSPENV